MTFRVSRFLAAATAAVLVLGAHSARAELLLYEGFATVKDNANRTPYLSSVDSHKLTGDNAKGVAWTVGLSSSYPWSASSETIYTFRNGGLSLPTAFAEGTGDQFTARGGSAGYLNSSATDSDLRAKNRAIQSTMPTTGKLYYRCLMKIEPGAYNGLKGTSSLYNGTGISATPAVNSYSNQNDLKNSGIRIAFTGHDNRVDIYANIGGQDTNVLSNISAGTTYIAIVELDYDTEKANIYVAPISSYSKDFTWIVEDFAVPSAVTASAMQVMFIDGAYKTNSGRVMFDEIAVGRALSDVAVVIPATMPRLGAVSLLRTGAATYEITAEEARNTADISWVADDGATAPTTNLVQASVAAGTTATGTVSGLAADTTFQISAIAENATGADTADAGIIYTGALSLGAATDAYEFQLVAGGVEVSRANPDPWPLTVTYTISGSVGTEGTTWAAPTAVTIPANTASATLPVVPIMDDAVAEDVTITVSLAQSNYELPASNSATLTLHNLAVPAGKKTWVAAAAGLASDGANWSPSGAPTSSDHILFDGNFSNFRCTWDAAATHTVATWEQTANFSGTVELQTTYDTGAFEALAIDGDLCVNGGTITQTANSNAQTYRLSMTVASNLVVASGAKITATGKGYVQNQFPSGAAVGVHGGSVNDLSKVYGDLKHPVDIGAGGAGNGMAGGGAVHLVVAGDATIDGTIAAQPNYSENDTPHGAGGSIYLQAASVAGSGSITAAGYGFTASKKRSGGAGGRIAVICTTASALAFPTANIMCNGSISGYGETSGAGTIFVKDASQQNGTLIVDNALLIGDYYRAYWPTKRGVTPIPAGESWTLDGVQFRRYGVLCVPEGTTLTVSLSGVSGSSANPRDGGILYEGGTLNIGSAPYTFTGNWTFCADEPYTFNGDVTVTNGANFGGFKFSGTYKTDFAKCDVTVNGNLTIASGGYASVVQCGPVGDSAGTTPHHGGQMAGDSGNRCYGSVFDPVLPGCFTQNGDHGKVGVGGGALKLTVSGDLVVNGSVSATASVMYKSSAAAGSVNIRARTLSGTGSITATGNYGAIQWDNGYNGTGGRIAVRVTGEDVGTTGIWTKFAALGCSTNQVIASGHPSHQPRNQNTSAGTIYLQGASDGEKGGTIYVRNQASYDTSNVATWLPAGDVGDAAADFRKASLVIADRGVVAIDAETLKMKSVSIAANSKLDLNGNEVVVQQAFVGGAKLSTGTYTAGDAAVAGFVADNIGGGSLRVTGGSTFILLQ